MQYNIWIIYVTVVSHESVEIAFVSLTIASMESTTTLSYDPKVVIFWLHFDNSKFVDLQYVVSFVVLQASRLREASAAIRSLVYKQVLIV